MASSTPIPQRREAIPGGISGAWVVTVLRAGIPLSLLLDLAQRDPHSAELYAVERAS